jgi:hypothetical protein
VNTPEHSNESLGYLKSGDCYMLNDHRLVMWTQLYRVSLRNSEICYKAYKIPPFDFQHGESGLRFTMQY